MSYLVIRNVNHVPTGADVVKLPNARECEINAAGDAFFYGLTLGEPISDDLSALNRTLLRAFAHDTWSEIEWLEPPAVQATA